MGLFDKKFIVFMVLVNVLGVLARFFLRTVPLFAGTILLAKAVGLDVGNALLGAWIIDLTIVITILIAMDAFKIVESDLQVTSRANIISQMILWEGLDVGWSALTAFLFFKFSLILGTSYLLVLPAALAFAAYGVLVKVLFAVSCR